MLLRGLSSFFVKSKLLVIVLAISTIFLIMIYSSCDSANNIFSDLTLSPSDESSPVQTKLLDCPEGYITVPGSKKNNLKAFCLMKYEAKALYSSSKDFSDRSVSLQNNGTWSFRRKFDDLKIWLPEFKAVSIPEARPWTHTYRGKGDSGNGSVGSIEICQQLNSQQNHNGHYDLISNAEWQTVAQNIELEKKNWKEGVVGGPLSNHGGSDENHINLGFLDYLQIDSQAASATDSNFCFGLGVECLSDWTREKRTHVLSNGEIIWDLAGNVSEWVKDDIPLDLFPSLSRSDYSGVPVVRLSLATFSNLSFELTRGPHSGLRGTSMDFFGPVGTYTDIDEEGTYPYQDHLAGFGTFNYTRYSHGEIQRGGHSGLGMLGGIFYTHIMGIQETKAQVGFRCVFHPE